MQNDLKLFNSLVETLLEAEKRIPVAEPIPATELLDTLDIELQDEPALEKAFVENLKQVVLATPRTATNLFFNQLFGGRNSKATLGDLLAVILNNSMYTYKVAGVQVGIEKEIIKTVCQRMGYPQESGGTFAPGGSLANFTAMLMARDRVNLDIRHQGVSQKMCAYTSEESHYSIKKNAAFSGIGREQVRDIAVNSKGELIAEALKTAIEADIKKGNIPFFVNATAGTTVLGAFDPIEEISAICKTYGLWLHVDGAYSGGVIFSEKYKHLVKGLEHTDSFSFNAHKMMNTPLSSSLLMCRDKKHLYNSLSNEANYLYQTNNDDYNLGKTSLQCGRRNDALKFWTLWKAVGSKGLESMVNQQFTLADFSRDYIEKHPDYTLHSFNDSISVCFNYKGISAKNLCALLYEKAEIMVGYGHFKEHTFIRLITINAGNETKDLLNFFKTLEHFVETHWHLLEVDKAS